MKLYGLYVFRVVKNSTTEPLICSMATDVSEFGIFKRNSAREFLTFLARTVAKRIPYNSRNQINQDAHVVFAHSRGDGLCGVAVCDNEYNSRVAFTLVSQFLQDFTDQFHGKWETIEGVKDNFLQWPDLDRLLHRYQNPEEADKILRIKKDIEDTKVIMHQALDSVLERGEKIDNLVQRSEDLGMASKTFYKQAKKTNSSCCTIS